mmetsp:Transcript_4318/g.4761  ORF Transcript_4318/g.4761 Transcript_4318/m.4761 type:complete len:270 (+) Transcript_4318:147-956(+)
MMLAPEQQLDSLNVERGMSNSAVVNFPIDKKIDNRSMKDTEMEDVVEKINETKKSKSVRFFPHVTVREVLHVNEYTDEEVYLSWYRRSDFQKMKQSFILIIQKLENGCWPGDTLHETARGLEHRTREGSQRRKLRKLKGLMAVLDEQERQWMERTKDVEKISRSYMRFTVTAIHAARVIAQKDRQEVHFLWQNDLEERRRQHPMLQRLNFGNFETTVRIEPIDDSMPSNCCNLSGNENGKKNRLRQFMKKMNSIKTNSKSNSKTSRFEC